MPSGTALDSNVIIAAFAEDHIHHEPSAELLLGSPAGTFAVAAHSFAEMLVTLTKRSRGAQFAWTADQAHAALTDVASRTVLIGLTPEQTLTAIRRYAQAGGVGARLYDALIGEAALAAGLRRLITWNTTHLRGMFPRLEVLTPVEAAAGPSGRRD